jgi:hypothetical protein
MAYPSQFTSRANFELAFTRIVRGQNQDYKRFYRHLLSSYQLALSDNLHDLIDDIKRGTYKPSPGTLIFEPKKSGILRPLRLLTLRDLVVYQAVANVLATSFQKVQEKYAFDKCFGAIFAGKSSPFFYTKWKTSYKKYNWSIKRAFKAGNDFVADFDLVSFYELIDHNLLRESLRRQVQNQELLNLLFACLEMWSTNKRGARIQHGIPQGPEPSAFLAECFLFYFDALKFKRSHYFRYVDDIKLMAKDEVAVRRALLKLDIASKELGLVPQAQKIELRQVNSLSELVKSVPSNVASISTTKLVNQKYQKRLTRIFRASIHKSKQQWMITDPTKFKFSLVRMNPRRDILKRIAPMLVKRPDLSGIFAAYLRKFPADKMAADVLLNALRMDPTYDASAANYINAMDVCEPPSGHLPYRRAVQTVEQRSEEKSLHLKIASATFRGKRKGPSDALRLIEKQENPIARGILLHRLFGDGPDAPYKISNCLPLLQKEISGEDEDLARFSASLLLGLWPWSAGGGLKPNSKMHHSVKLLMKTLGLRKRAPKKLGVLDKFFQERMRIGMPISWRKALGKDWRDAEARCLRVQNLEIGDPSAYVLMLDTFNEVLLQSFSLRHQALRTAYRRASGWKNHPDYGNWLMNPVISKVLARSSVWFLEVHRTRVKADLAHAKSKKGERTRPVSYWKKDNLRRQAQMSWAELIKEWKKIL